MFRLRVLAPSRTAVGALLLALLAVAACGGDPVAPPPESDVIASVDPADTLFASVAVGDEHSCALTRGGRAFCWGLGDAGQLGSSERPPGCAGACALTPVPVSGGLRFTQLAARANVTCGLRPSGAVACWGNAASWASSRAALHGAPPLRSLALTSRRDVCGLDASGQAWCGAAGTTWAGSDSLNTLRAVPGGVRFRAIGDNCGTTASGALYCWNGTVDTAVFDPGQVVLDRCDVGASRTVRSFVPCSAAAVRLRAPVAMSQPARQSRDCALDVAGAAYCWGTTRAEYERAGFTRPDTSVTGRLPAPVAFPLPLTVLFGEPLFASGALCGSAASGEVYCRGSDAYGVFGNGPTPTAAWTPVLVAGGMRLVSVASSRRHMCSATAAGAVYCWGMARSGQLGAGTAALETCQSWELGEQACLTRPRHIASIAGR